MTVVYFIEGVALRYFLLRQDKRFDKYASISEPICVRRVWQGDEPFNSAYKAQKPQGYIHFLPLLEEPVFMVTEEVKKVFNTYQSQIDYIPFGLGDQNIRNPKIYYLVQPPEIDCLSSEVEFCEANCVKKIILDKKKIRHNNVFRIKGARKNNLVASMIIVEALLSERINEFEFIELECKE